MAAPSRAGAIDAEILIAGDLFRLLRPRADGGLHWHQAANMAVLRKLIAAAFASTPDIRVAILDHAALGLDQDAFGPGPADDPNPLWRDRLAAPLDRRLADRIARAARGRIVIGFELPGPLRACIEGAALALIDLTLSPLRFLDDLLFEASTRDAGIAAALAEAAIGPRAIAWSAGLLRAAIEDGADLAALPDRVALVAAQMSYDRAVIVDGDFVGLAAFIDRIARLAAAHDLLLLKLHPYQADVPGLDRLLPIPNLRLTRANAYRLLASGKVRTVAAISSSLLAEAPSFGAEVERFATPDWERARDPYVTIAAAALAGGIADAIAARLGIALPPRDGWRPPENVPVLRRLVGDDWGLAQAAIPAPVLPSVDLGVLGPGDHGGGDPRLQPAFVHGWHPPEMWGVWASGAVATLALGWPDPACARIALSFALLAPAVPGEEGRPIDIWIAGSRVATLDASSEPRWTDTIELRRPILAGPLQVHFVTRAIGPEARAMRDSGRTLGAGVFSLRWRPI